MTVPWTAAKIVLRPVAELRPHAGNARVHSAEQLEQIKASMLAFGFAFTIDANRSLTFTLHEVYLALAKTPIEGPAGVEASFEFRAAFNATATRMMTAVLKNQQAGTEYA